MFLRLLSVLLSLFFLTGCERSKPTLRVFTWASYFDSDVIAQFEEEYNCKVTLDMFDSNELMYAKLRSGRESYDIVTPSIYMAEIMAEQGMIEPIDYDKVRNIQYLDTDYCQLKDYVPYSVPYLLSFTGIGYLKGRVQEDDISWSLFKDPKYKWRSTLLNDFRETLGSGLIHLGLDPNFSTAEDLAACVNELKSWKVNIAKFENEQYKLGLDSAEFVLVHGYNGDIAQVMSENPDVSFALPKEGFTYSVDVFCIQKGSEKRDLAHAFIDFMHRPQIAAHNIAHTLYLCPNSASYKYLTPNLRSNTALFIPKEQMKRAHLLVDLGPGNNIFLEAWDKLKSSR